MAFHDYHFTTRWRIRGPIRTVYDVLKDGEAYGRWWKPAYVFTQKVGVRSIRALVRARLPYTLEFTTELVREDPPREIEIRSTGELAGRGLWRLEQNGGDVAVTFFWDVCVEKAWVKLLSPFLRPLFKWNHDWVMRTGEAALQSEMDRRSIRNTPSPGG